MLPSPLLSSLGGFIGGRWVGADARDHFTVRNPATGGTLARLPLLSGNETLAAIETALPAVAQNSAPSVRQAWLQAIEEELLRERDELARIITLEHGKPLRESVAEVEYAAAFFRFFAREVEALAPRSVALPGGGCRWTVHYRPAGVVGLITPWNFPLALLAKKVAPALAAGCSAVVKPASRTPLSALALFHLLERVGLPPGLMNLVVGSADPIGRAMCTHPAVRLISFTGSTEVGKELLRLTAPHVKRLALELGGNAPFIVFADADLDAAAAALVANKFRAGGQTCVCTNRVYVQRELGTAFTERVAERVRGLRVGDGLDPNTDVGPLIDAAGFDKVAAHVADALSRGAKRVVGGDPARPVTDWGAFYPPTLLTGVTADMRVCREETFGPVVALSEFDDEQGVIRAANDTPYGLAAYVFTRDSARAQRVIPQLHFGHIGLNTGTGPTPDAPFGGMKQSGLGREGGLEGLLEFCETQVVASA